MKLREWQDRQSLLMAIHDASEAQREKGIGVRERLTRSMYTNQLVIEALFTGASPRSIIHSFARENTIKGSVSRKV